MYWESLIQSKSMVCKTSPFFITKKSQVLVEIFFKVALLYWKEKVNKLNAAIAAEKWKCKKFSEEEVLVGLGLIIGAAEFSQKGVNLFGSKKVEE